MAGATSKIKLARSEIRNANHYFLHGFRLRVDVTEAVGIPAEVFVYSRKPADPYTGLVEDVWSGIASFPDLAEYPVGAPNPDLGCPFFRQSFIEVDVRSQKDYEKIWQLVVDQVKNLKIAFDKAADLVVVEEATIGEDEVVSDSLSFSD
jgi:hypothetical protein